MQQEERRITKDYLKKLLRKEFKLYYTTPELNDCLYLHYKGFEKIENLEEFTGLKVIYLEGNGLNNIEGLDCLISLKCLYLQENVIRKIENLNMLTELINLNLSDNMISKIEGYDNSIKQCRLEQCQKLQTLQIKRNRIGLNGLSDLEGLLCLPNLSVLDVSDNKIDDPNVLDEIFLKMPQLSVLYFQNNTAGKQIQHYRKTLISRIKTLKYLDDRPVFDDERRFAEAFAKGGLDLEREERQKYKKEQEEEHMRQHQNFKDMIRRYREEQQQQQESQQQEELQQVDNVSENEEPSHLSTYNTQSNASDVRSSAQQSAQHSEHQSEKHSDKQSDNQSENNSRIADGHSEHRSVDGDQKSVDGASDHGSEQVEINAIGNFGQSTQLDEID